MLRLAGLATIMLLGGMLLILFRRGTGSARSCTRHEENEHTAMFDNFPLWPARASTMAGNVDALYIFLVLISAFMCAGDLHHDPGVRRYEYRRRPGVAGRADRRLHKLEITWSVVPLFIFLVIFAWGAFIYFQERTPPRDATEVYVVAKQWMWKIQHPEGQREINELHVPVGRDVKLIMTSQDVIHSFYVPAFRIKQDVLPGRYTTVWFQRDQAGNLSLVLRRVLRHAALRHGRAGRGDGARRNIRPGSAAARSTDRWRTAGRSCSSNSAARPATAPTPRDAARIWSACSASRCCWKTDAP